jgi:hypothetical protein
MVNDMPPDETRSFRKDMLLASVMIVAGLTISGASLAEIATRGPQQMAQATPPLQSTPGAESKPSAPADPVTTGQRPAEIPPQPASPNADAQKAGAAPVLPPAPAEKMAAPIKEK